jgi:hypothetical protein
MYLLALVLCSGGLAYAHGANIQANWHVAQWEDTMFFRYNSDQVHSVPECFEKRGVWQGLYRPLTTNLYYYIGHKAFGDRVEPYHLITLIFLVLNALLLYRLAELFMGRWWAMIPAVLFASRYALVEVVLHTCEFQGLFYVFLSILSVDCFVRSRRSPRSVSWSFLAVSGGAFVLALLSKETAIAVPAVLVLYGRLFDDSIARREYLLHPAIAVAWVLPFWLLTRHQSAGFSHDFSMFNILRNYGAYFLDFSNWVLTPFNDPIMPARVPAFAGKLPVRSSFTALIVLEALVFAFPKMLKTQEQRVIAFGFGWFLATTLPFAIFASRLFMRYSYLGHAGLALSAGAIACGGTQLIRHVRPVAAANLPRSAVVWKHDIVPQVGQRVSPSPSALDS